MHASDVLGSQCNPRHGWKQIKVILIWRCVYRASYCKVLIWRCVYRASYCKVLMWRCVYRASYCKVLIWRCVYRASYCKVLITKDMHNSYNQILFHSFLSALHVSNESSSSSSEAQKVSEWAPTSSFMVEGKFGKMWKEVEKHGLRR